MFSRELAQAVARVLTGRGQTSEAGGLTVQDLRDDWRLDHDQVTAAVADAAAYVARARGGFPELVTDHLRQVVVLDTQRCWASVLARGYYTGLPLVERRDAQCLASRLVWAATFIRLSRNMPWWRRRQQDSAIRRGADDAQTRFLDRFSDGGEWGQSLETYRD